MRLYSRACGCQGRAGIGRAGIGRGPALVGYYGSPKRLAAGGERGLSLAAFATRAEQDGTEPSVTSA